MNKQPTKGVYESEPVAVIPFSQISVIELCLLKEAICDADEQAVIVPVSKNAQQLIMLQKRSNKDIDWK